MLQPQVALPAGSKLGRPVIHATQHFGSLAPVADVKLYNDVVDVVLDGRNLKTLAPCNLFVGLAIGQKRQDVAFTAGQMGLPVRLSFGPRQPQEPFLQQPSDARRADKFPAQGRADDADQIVNRLIRGDSGRRPGLDRGKKDGVVAVRPKGDDRAATGSGEG